MRRSTIALSLLLVPCVLAIAPRPVTAWQTVVSGNLKDSDGDFANDVAVDPNGDVVVTGELVMKGDKRTNIEFATAKLAKGTGAVIWRTSLLTPRTFDFARVLALNGAGDVFVAGKLDTGFAVARLAGASGAETWRKTTQPVDGDALALTLDAAGNPVAAGLVNRTNILERDFYVTKLNAASGAELWKFQLTDGFALAVAVDGDGNVIASGVLTEEVNTFELATCLIVKLDGTTGAEIWRHEIEGAGPFPDARCDALAVTSGGDVLVGGERDVTGFDDETFVARLAKATGNELYRQVTDPALRSTLSEIELDANGDLFVVGFHFGLDFPAAFTKKITPATGATVWENRIVVPELFEDGDGTRGFDVAIDDAGDVGVAVQLDHKKGSAFGVAKLAGATGTELVRRSFPKKTGVALGVAFGDDGTLFAAGQSNFHWLVVNVAPSSAGKSIVVQDNALKPAKRKLQVQVADDAFALGTPGGGADPTVVGATLQIKNPTSGETQTFQLPAANWVGSGKPPGAKGYKYADKELAAGPCKAVQLKSGSWQAKCAGEQITFTLDEPSQGSLGATLTIGGQRSCAVFGGEVKKDIPAAGKVVGVFQAKKAPAPESCP